MEYKLKWNPSKGLSEIVRPGDAGLIRICFGLLRLGAGETRAVAACAKETALVFLGGTGSVRGNGFAFEEVGRRSNVFSGKAAAVFLPSGHAYTLHARSDLEVAVCQAASDREGKARMILPDEVKVVSLGRDNWERCAHMIIDDRIPAHYLFIGEALVPSGNWASFPPHRHDKDDLPEEVDMEEVYFFRFNPPQGFGIQKIYTDDRSIDLTMTVEENDTVLIPRGYHPVANAPGYSMYYLWIMAGVNRKFLSRQDPTHRWVGQL